MLAVFRSIRSSSKLFFQLLHRPSTATLAPFRLVIQSNTSQRAVFISSTTAAAAGLCNCVFSAEYRRRPPAAAGLFEPELAEFFAASIARRQLQLLAGMPIVIFQLGLHLCVLKLAFQLLVPAAKNTLYWIAPLLVHANVMQHT